jgi:hypothetical protein
MNIRLSKLQPAILSLAATLGVSLSAHAEVTTLVQTDRGAINSPAAGGAKVVSGSHQVRYSGSAATTRAYFTYDLSTVTGFIVGAELRITHPSNSYDSPDQFETVVLHEVAAANADLSLVTSDPTGAIFTDLGDGPVYGEFEARLTDNSTVESVPLNPAALAALNAVKGTAQRWSTGLDITTATAAGTTSERVLRGTATATAATQLVLTTTVAPPPNLPALGSSGRVGLWAALGGIVFLTTRSVRQRVRALKR